MAAVEPCGGGAVNSSAFGSAFGGAFDSLALRR
jgi:hypothetical protein